jgi:D-alanyl-lipoteichoic acid acyltransferase DltB (MBOAT superfamily)
MLTYRLGGFYNLPAIPFGVLAYLLFIPLFWILPVRWVRAAVIATSIALAVLTWPLQWCLTLCVAVGYGYALIAFCQARTRRLAPGDAPSQVLVISVWLAVHVAYLPALIWPEFGWLPDEPAMAIHHYYWVAWLGMAYLALRVLHVAIDVCHGKIERVSLADYLAYILFAPVFRMGPIMRYQDFIAQLQVWPGQRTRRNLGVGLFRIVLGLARLGVMGLLMTRVVDSHFMEAPQLFSRATVLGFALLLPIALYMWIGGYIDVAVGLGRTMGFVVPENFHWPLRSTSVREFWKRWHITLGGWAFEYIYIPLGGNRKKVFLNYLATFFYIALWHGLVASYVVCCVSQAPALYINRRWRLYWLARRESHGPLYESLRRVGLVGGRFSISLGWSLTIGFELLALAIFMDEVYAGRRWVGYLLGLYHG